MYAMSWVKAALSLGGLVMFLNLAAGGSLELAAAAGQPGAAAPREQNSPEAPEQSKATRKKAAKKGSALSKEPQRKSKKKVSRGYGGGEIRHRPAAPNAE